MISFIVYGRPQPQGSSRAFVVKGRAVITSTNKNLKSWRQEVSRVAIDKMNDGSSIIKRPSAVVLTVEFHFSRPASLKRSLTAHTKRPDIDKLVRGLADALTGIVYEDDSQIVMLTARKLYDSPERTEVMIEG